MSGEERHHLGEDLAQMADGGKGLAPARKEELERHVAGCAECQAAIRSAQIVLRVVDRELPPVPSERFDAALFRRLDAIDADARRQAASAAPSLLERLAAFFTLPRFAAVAAAAAALVLAVVIGRGLLPEQPGKNDALLGSMTPELAQNLDVLAFAEDLDLYQNLDVVEDLDVIDDLEVIKEMDEAG